MKTAALFIFLSIFSIHSFAQTGYVEFEDEAQGYSGDIQVSNDGHLIIVSDYTIQKTDKEGNVIWRTEISASTFRKLIAIPGDGYYVFCNGTMEHFSEEGVSLSYTTFSVADFGYSDDVFIDDNPVSLYYNGSGFTCVGYLKEDLDEWTYKFYYTKYELSTDGSILWHTDHYVGTSTEGSMGYPYIVKAGAYDLIYYHYYEGSDDNLVIDKTSAGSGDIISTSYLPGENIQGIFPVSDGTIVYTTTSQEKFTKILSASGDTAWSNFSSGDGYIINFLSQLESGNLVGLHQNLDFFAETTTERLEFFSSEGDSLTILPPFLTFEDSGWERDFIHGMAVLDGGRLAFAGFNFNSHFPFLLITDTLGNFYHVNIKGKLYHDANTNGIYDADETVFGHRMIKSEPITYYAYTNENGDYNMLVGKDTAYDISLTPIAGWDIIDPDPLSIVITAAMDGDTLSGNDFHLDYTTAVHDVAVYLFQQQIAPGFATSSFVSITNQGNQYDESGTVTLHFPSILLDPVVTPDFFSIDDTIITWNYSDLDPYETQTFEVSYFADTLLYMIGESVLTQANVTTSAADADTADNNYMWYDEIVGSFDPNHKTVAPAGEGEDGYISYETNYLTYTIEFQNTGTAEAHFINIYDTLDTELNIESLEMLSSSHNYELIITAPNILRWKFDPINLPDSSTNLAGSMGYLTFRIKLNEDAGIGDVIENTAGIYFDYNPVVLTNTVKNTLAESDAIQEVSGYEAEFNVYPNPAVKYLTIDMKENTTEETEILVTDIAGKLCLHDHILPNRNSKTLQIDGLNAGSYFITVKGSGKDYGTKYITIIK